MAAAEVEEAKPMEEDGGECGRCPLCKEELGDRYWPHVRVVPSDGGAARLCHLRCLLKLLSGGCGEASLPGVAEGGLGATPIDKIFAQDLLRVVAESPQLYNRNPALRICGEEQRLAKAAVDGKWPTWPFPAFPAPPPAAFAFEGITEIRISACAALRALPPEIGRFRGMVSLVLISNGLESLPEEVGRLRLLQHLFVNGNFLRTLPASIGALPALREVCFDANQLEALPDFVSRDLTLFTAPGNKLAEMPAVAGGLDRLEIHGNAMSSLALTPRAGLQPRWDHLVCLKIMGNRLRELPPELGYMRWLRVLLVSSNLLEALPDSVSQLPWLEWLFAYDNRLRELPTGVLLGSRRLERVLLEGNPLSPASTTQLLAELPESRVVTVGLDVDQGAACAAAAAPGSWQPLPPRISVGRMVRVPGEGQYTLKLIRGSQLRRGPGVPAVGEPGGPTSPDSAPARLLIVAFSASQGEPEWLGLLRRLAERESVTPQPPPNGTFQDLLEGMDASDAEACLSRIWSGCTRQSPDGGDAAQNGEAAKSIPLGEFDVLSGVDHRMRWYSEDAPGLSQALSEICAPYNRVLFVGASMGGFGALRHGGRLGDAVIAFSPQADLPEASLRPPGANSQALVSLAEELFDSICSASARGAQVDVHCAADEHLMHALTMPLAHLELTVHPLLPRKPFARLLDRAGVLLPIMCDAVARLLQAPPREPGAPRGGCRPPPLPDAGPRVTIARWRTARCPTRHHAEPGDLLRLFFGPRAADMPRPGDWFCQLCHRRNMSVHFFCYKCGAGEADAQVSAMGTPCVPGHNYPQSGDWGCGSCLQAMCSYQDTCSRCGKAKWGGHEQTFIVA